MPSGVDTGIALRGLKKTYPSSEGPIEAVRGIDLDIASGETLALLGPNGAGKSTTIDMVLGLSRPDAGTVTVFGGTPEQAVAAGSVGAMLQAGALMRDLTVRELLLQLASLYPHAEDVDKTLELAEITEIANQRTQKLSGGQAQRVRFAMALITDANLLVLDEPTVGMDVESRHAFWTTMRRLASGGRTILFATHYLEEADEFADRVVLMAHGAVVADGTPNEIKSKVGSRTIRVTLPETPAAELEGLPGVTAVERRGTGVVLTCSDSDVALRALVAAFPEAHNFEIGGGTLEEAFLELTA